MHNNATIHVFLYTNMKIGVFIIYDLLDNINIYIKEENTSETNVRTGFEVSSMQQLITTVEVSL